MRSYHQQGALVTGLSITQSVHAFHCHVCVLYPDWHIEWCTCRYVLKSQMKELLELEAKNAISIEEEIENERKKVDAKTPITEEVSQGHYPFVLLYLIFPFHLFRFCFLAMITTVRNDSIAAWDS